MEAAIKAEERAEAGARRETLESFNPATGEKLGEVRLSQAADVEAAVKRAREAQRAWHAIGARARAVVLKKVQAVMLRRSDEIITTLNRENGKPRCEAATMIISVCEALDFYTKFGVKTEHGLKVSSGKLFMGAKTRVFFEPRGVCGFIMPWNFPFELGMKHMIPALMAGNAVVQKPSEHNPLIGDLIRSIYLEAGVPEDVVQIVHGFGDVGVALIDNVDSITFIGSPQTGKKIMARAAENLIPVILELGGKDAAVVRRDADIDKTARGLVTGACLNAGQVCISVERVYVHKDIVKPLTDRIVEQVGKLRQGDTENYDLGPIKWAPQRKIYEAHVADAVAKGATVLTGGKAIEAHGGVYWPPTVLANVTQDMEVMREETFGPFIPIMAVESDEEAVRLANDSVYGLGGSVWTADVEKGEEIARKMNAGSITLNNALVSGACPTLPFGGNRSSGVGRAFGELGYYNYTSPRSFMRTANNKSSELLWMPYPKTAEAFVLALGRVLYGGGLGVKAKGLAQLLKNRPK